MTSLACDEAVREFLLESHENLDQLDREFLALETDPSPARIATIFRTVHTVKGTAGFLGFSKLERLSHAGETLLSRARDGALTLTPEDTTALLALVDRVRGFLQSIESTGSEGAADASDLADHLIQLASRERTDAEPASPPTPAVESPREAEPAVALEAQSTPPAGTAAAAPAPLPDLPPPPREPVALPLATAEEPAPAKPPASGEKPKAVGNPAPMRVGADAAHPEAVAEPQVSSVAESSVRIDVDVLDKLMTLVGELVLARNQAMQVAASSEDGALLGALQRLNLITTELQESVMKTRMQPIGSVWNRLPRIVRDLAVTCGKQVRVEMLGKGTELDRTVVDAIRDPLTHIVRNAVDHGIEAPDRRAAAGKPRTGKLALRAFHESGQVIIEIADDGAGIDPERIRAKAVEKGIVSPEVASRMNEHELQQLIFLPGFSTAPKVTNVSGRGVGMDVVKTNIERIGGTVDLQSTPGVGSTLRIRIPLTLAIIPAVLVSSRGHHFAVPQASLLELVRLEGTRRDAIERIHGAPVYRLRDKMLPLVRLDRVLDMAGADDASGDGAINIMVLRADDKQFGLVVDRVLDTEEIVVKPLGHDLKSISTFAGATIMGDGKVALILDVLGVAQRASVVREAATQVRNAASERMAGDLSSLSVEERSTLLVCGIGGARRGAIPLSQVERLEEFAPERIEQTGEYDCVVQYRGEILPLVRLSELAETDARMATSPVQTIIYSENGRRVGLVVDSIVDIVEDVRGAETGVDDERLVRPIVVHGRVTDLVDVRTLLHRQQPDLCLGARP
ncbi:MAG: chemotaxis protein CheA [Polyangiaceae bacterium]